MTDWILFFILQSPYTVFRNTNYSNKEKSLSTNEGGDTDTSMQAYIHVATKADKATVYCIHNACE